MYYLYILHFIVNIHGICAYTAVSIHIWKKDLPKCDYSLLSQRHWLTLHPLFLTGTVQVSIWSRTIYYGSNIRRLSYILLLHHSWCKSFRILIKAVLHVFTLLRLEITSTVIMLLSWNVVYHSVTITIYFVRLWTELILNSVGMRNNSTDFMVTYTSTPSVFETQMSSQQWIPSLEHKAWIKGHREGHWVKLKVISLLTLKHVKYVVRVNVTVSSNDWICN